MKTVWFQTKAGRLVEARGDVIWREGGCSGRGAWRVPCYYQTGGFAGLLKLQNLRRATVRREA